MPNREESLTVFYSFEPAEARIAQIAENNRSGYGEKLQNKTLAPGDHVLEFLLTGAQVG